ncbi:MAG: DUF3500 domain-containing protein [Endozoicomonadaceae bacterium]|nr:DUF3500 domain-containing protein [Endozoicomonadaceae bacterium]
MNYQNVRQSVITSVLVTSLLAAISVSQVAADQKVTEKESAQSRHSELYTQTINRQLTELIALFSKKDLMQLQMDNNQLIKGKPLTSLDDSIGLDLNTLSYEQRASLHRLLATALSSGGYQHLTAIINQEFVHQEMAEQDEFLLTEHLPDARLLLTGHPDSSDWGIRLGSPWFNVDIFFNTAKDQHSITMGPLFLASYPTQVPEAPKVDLRQTHYPYLRWHEQAGQTILWQMGDFSRTAIKQLRKSIRNKTCLKHDQKTNECPMISMLPDPVKFMALNVPTVRIDQLTEEERYYFTRLVNTMLDNWRPEVRHQSDVMKKLGKAQVAWAGNLETADTGFYLRIHSEFLLIEFIQTPHQSGSDTMVLPNNATFLTVRDPKSVNDFDPLRHTVELLQPNKEIVRQNAPEEKSANKSSSDATSIDNANLDDSMDSNAIIWLKKTSYLEGAEIRIGHKGKIVPTGRPFYPVVRTFMNGSLHQNMNISITIHDQHGEEWLGDFPLPYDKKQGIYTTGLTLPKSMKEAPITITYSVSRPGSRYEGIYEATLRPDTVTKAVPDKSIDNLGDNLDDNLGKESM